MNAVFRLALMSIASLGLAACASSGGTASVASPGAATAPQPGDIVQNDDYINRVENNARMRGIQVKWLKPPTRRIASN